MKKTLQPKGILLGLLLLLMAIASTVMVIQLRLNQTEALKTTEVP